jgi:hypothetical protein
MKEFNAGTHLVVGALITGLMSLVAAKADAQQAGAQAQQQNCYNCGSSCPIDPDMFYYQRASDGHYSLGENTPGTCAVTRCGEGAGVGRCVDDLVFAGSEAVDEALKVLAAKVPVRLALERLVGGNAKVSINLARMAVQVEGCAPGSTIASMRLPKELAVRLATIAASRNRSRATLLVSRDL